MDTRPGSEEGRANPARCGGQDLQFPDMVPALETGAVEAAILTEPFPTLAEERGVAERPLPRPAGAKATPITAIFWNKGLGDQGARAGPEGDGGLPEGGPRPRARQRLEAGAQHRSDGQVHRRQGRRHPPRARPRPRPEPRHGSRGPRIDATPERRDGISEVQRLVARLAPLQLRLPGQGGGGARQEVAQGRRPLQRPRSLGSSASRSESPKRLKPNTPRLIAMPGNSAIHGAFSAYEGAEPESISPQDGVGSAAPSPR